MTTAPLAVFVPTDPARTLSIDSGSGIVGTVDGPMTVIDYEGNRYGSTSMVTWADRVHHAAGRHADRYPTVARSVVPAVTLVQVGTFDSERGQVHLDPAQGARVADWLGIPQAAMDDQLRTTSARHQMRREVDALRADPARRVEADWLARRYRLDRS